MSKLTTRLAVTATASLAALGLSASAASALPGDAAVLSPAGTFRLAAGNMEPGCYLATEVGSPVADHIDVTQLASEAHLSVVNDADFSVDQILVPGMHSGYAVYNRFDTGSNSADADVDPNQSATDLAAPGGDDVDADGLVVCVSDHPDGDQNEPYVSDGLPGEVAALNRPIIDPKIAALGVSAENSLNTYKVGFGYTVPRGYDMTWRNKFGSGGDPNASAGFTKVTVDARAKQPGVLRFNDIDEFGEAFTGSEPDYGQPTVFDLAGDPYAYLHNSNGLMTFTTQGDLPISWSVKPSLAPEAYGRTVKLTDDMLRAWNASWQDYYAGKGPKPEQPLPPGSNSPAPAQSITVIVNPPETRPGTAPQQPVTTTNNTTIVNPPAATVAKAAAKTQRATVRSVRLMRMKDGHRILRVFVSSGNATERIQFRMYSASGRKIAQTTKRVRTNSVVKLRSVHIAKRVASVKAAVK